MILPLLLAKNLFWSMLKLTLFAQFTYGFNGWLEWLFSHLLLQSQGSIIESGTYYSISKNNDFHWNVNVFSYLWYSIAPMIFPISCQFEETQPRGYWFAYFSGRKCLLMIKLTTSIMIGTTYSVSFFNLKQKIIKRFF